MSFDVIARMVQSDGPAGSVMRIDQGSLLSSGAKQLAQVNFKALPNSGGSPSRDDSSLYGHLNLMTNTP